MINSFIALVSMYCSCVTLCNVRFCVERFENFMHMISYNSTLASRFYHDVSLFHIRFILHLLLLDDILSDFFVEISTNPHTFYQDYYLPSIAILFELI